MTNAIRSGWARRPGVGLWLAALGLALGLAACSFPAGDASPEDKIQEYLYSNQPTTGSEFVAWARRNLDAHSPQRVYRALQTVGALQASRGHPNSVGVLSFAAQAWAAEYGLRYDANHWLALQQEAMGNLRAIPGPVKFWPD